MEPCFLARRAVALRRVEETFREKVVRDSRPIEIPLASIIPAFALMLRLEDDAAGEVADLRVIEHALALVVANRTLRCATIPSRYCYLAIGKMRDLRVAAFACAIDVPLAKATEGTP